MCVFLPLHRVLASDFITVGNHTKCTDGERLSKEIMYANMDTFKGYQLT